MQPLRPLLLLAVLAGARANCVDPGSVSPTDVGTKYCCRSIMIDWLSGPCGGETRAAAGEGRRARLRLRRVVRE